MLSPTNIAVEIERSIPNGIRKSVHNLKEDDESSLAVWRDWQENAALG